MYTGVERCDDPILQGDEMAGVQIQQRLSVTFGTAHTDPPKKTADAVCKCTRKKEKKRLLSPSPRGEPMLCCLFPPPVVTALFHNDTLSRDIM